MPKITIQPLAEDKPLNYHLLVDGKRRGTLYFPRAETGIERLYRCDHDLGDAEHHYAPSLHRMLGELQAMADREAGRRGRHAAVRAISADAVRALDDGTLLDALCSDDPAALISEALAGVPEPAKRYSVKINRLDPQGRVEAVWSSMTNATTVVIPELVQAWYEVGVQFFPGGFGRDSAATGAIGHATFWPAAGCETKIVYGRPAARDMIHIAIIDRRVNASSESRSTPEPSPESTPESTPEADA